MSRRRIEQGSATASSFSLRALSAVSSVEPPVPSLGRRAAPPPTGAAATLSFKFASLGVKPAPPPAPRPVAHLPANFFGKAAAVASGKEPGDALRMAAMIDDLTTRLRKSNEAKTQLEGQVQRINAALVQERNNYGSKIQALKGEVSAVQESENKMRAELVSRPAAKEVGSARFLTSVRSALEQEETNARVADGEAKASALAKRAEALTSEVKLLEGRKAQGIDAQASALSAEEVEVLVTKGAAAQARLLELEDHHSVISDSIAHLEALRASHTNEAAEAEAALLKANEATAMSVADAAGAKAQAVELEGKVLDAEARLGGLQAAATRPHTEVSGAVAPTNLLGRIEASPAQQVDALACCATGVGYHFAHDCPIGLTATHSSAADTTGDLMVQAIVSDLKSYFNSAVAEHAKLGVVVAAA